MDNVLFSSILKPSTEKRLKYDLTLPTILITCSFSVLWNKKVNPGIVYWVKNSNSISFLQNVSYFLVVLLSFIIPFPDDICSFHFSLFDLVIFISSPMLYIFATFDADH